MTVRHPFGGGQRYRAGFEHGPHGDITDSPGLGALFDRNRLIVCVGSGGVGKTTTAAALGVAAARRGRHAVVLAIDPARRLKDTLALAALDAEPHNVPLGHLCGPKPGSLDAALLDTKRTFDTLITRLSPTTAAAERVLANPIYQSISTALAGSQEYMAMEQLHAIASSSRYDALVVDTPPTQHALDFLEAPQRIIALLSSQAAAILQRPSLILSRNSSKLAQLALAAVLRGLERFTGFELLREIAEFVAGIEGLSEGFQSRAADVARLLRRSDTTFLLVTTPEAARIGETLAFHHELLRAQLPFGGFVVNRVMPAELVGEKLPDPECEKGQDLRLARKLAAIHRRFAALVRSERAEIGRLKRIAKSIPIAEIPLRAEEPTSLASLVTFAAALDR